MRETGREDAKRHGVASLEWVQVAQFVVDVGELPDEHAPVEVVQVALVGKLGRDVQGAGLDQLRGKERLRVLGLMPLVGDLAGDVRGAQPSGVGEHAVEQAPVDGDELGKVAARIPTAFSQQHRSGEHAAGVVGGMIVKAPVGEPAADDPGGLPVRGVDQSGYVVVAPLVSRRGAHRRIARRHRFQCAVFECKCDCARTFCWSHS